jgi:hypothetical protein
LPVKSTQARYNPTGRHEFEGSGSVFGVNRDVWIQGVLQACSVSSGKSDHMDAVLEGQNEEAPP